MVHDPTIQRHSISTNIFTVNGLRRSVNEAKPVPAREDATLVAEVRRSHDEMAQKSRGCAVIRVVPSGDWTG
jgi:hypothetical protein